MHAVIFDLDSTIFSSDMALHDDVTSLLAILRRLGVKVGALTTADHRMLVRLDEAGIRNHFDTVICTAHVTEPKAPEGVQHVLNRLNVAPQHTAFVSHLDDDMTLGKRSGLGKMIHVVHGPVRKGRMAVDADYAVADIAAVLDVLE
jgi:FMN phosphatase YigB (HAD superfamily)